eukprot:13413550-Alexandrium_andersonii.AAC.1
MPPCRPPPRWRRKWRHTPARFNSFRAAQGVQRAGLALALQRCSLLTTASVMTKRSFASAASGVRAHKARRAHRQSGFMTKATKHWAQAYRPGDPAATAARA